MLYINDNEIQTLKHVDKWLYGHPGHKVFDSPNRFFPHFKYIMENQGDSLGCPCTVCNAKGGTVLPIGSSARSRGPSRTVSGRSTPKVLSKAASTKAPHLTQPKGRPKIISAGMDTTRVDEEGTPDVYRNLIDKLQKYQTLDEPINEPLSMDWHAEQECLPRLKHELEASVLYSPRVGDIVLFVTHLNEGTTVSRDRKSGEFKLYHQESKTFLGYPKWEAGLVGQTPAELTDLEDIVHEPPKESSVSISGLRIESLPHPNHKDKSLSKRYHYVPLHQTRPFVFWREFLYGIEEKAWHPTIRNALTPDGNILPP